MAPQQERDWPVGHPKTADYDPNSPEAKEYARLNFHPLGERDWPVDHINASDTPGNQNTLVWEPGIDPRPKAKPPAKPSS
jgi:hypothetical protein